jgi:ADP-ribose pyrophosphatase YjhB (NUDIX family)
VLRQLHLLLLRIFRMLPRRGRLAVVHRLAPSFTVGAICVIERADARVLLVRHSYRSRWGFPGGLLKRGEGVHDGARREAMEEVGLPIELIGEPAVVVDPDARRVDVVFRCRVPDRVDPDTITSTSPEIVEARWIAREALPELQPEASGALIALARAAAAGGHRRAS